MHCPLLSHKLNVSNPKTWFLKGADANASLTLVGKFNMGKLYGKIGFNKEIISRGRFAELLAAEHRPFSLSGNEALWLASFLNPW